MKSLINKFKSKQDNLKLFGSACLIFVSFLFILYAFFGYTYAWFEDHTKVTAEGMKVRVQDSNDLDINVCTAIYYNNVEGLYKSIDLMEDKQLVSIPEYDHIFVDRNDKTSLIIRVAVTGIDDEMTDLQVNLSCSQDLLDDDNKALRYLSNVMMIKAGAGLYNPETSTIVMDEFAPEEVADNLQYIYENSKLMLANEDSHSFVTINEEEYNKDYSISINVSLDEVRDFIDEDKLILNIMIDYSPELVDYVLTNTVNDTGEKINFDEDLGTIYLQGIVNGGE